MQKERHIPTISMVLWSTQSEAVYVKISYKNRNGVRKEGALDWRELYEIFILYGKTAILLRRRPEEVLSGDKAEG